MYTKSDRKNLGVRRVGLFTPGIVTLFIVISLVPFRAQAKIWACTDFSVSKMKYAATQEACKKICAGGSLIKCLPYDNKADAEKGWNAGKAEADKNKTKTTGEKFNTIDLKDENPLTTTDIDTTLGGVIRIFTGIAGSLALLMFVYGSLLLMTSRGEADKVNKGKRAMLMAAVGLVIIFGAYAIIQTIFTGIGI